MAKKDALQLMRSEFDRFFNEPGWWPALHRPSFRFLGGEDGWNPQVDVFQKENRLVTKIDLPGLKKEDVKVEVTDGHLAISGERRREQEEKEKEFYRCEREYGSFYRVVPLPESIKLEDVNATFTDGVLEVSVPLPAKTQPAVKRVEIQEPAKATKTAA
jgi:HSP20 family protein